MADTRTEAERLREAVRDAAFTSEDPWDFEGGRRKEVIVLRAVVETLGLRWNGMSIDEMADALATLLTAAGVEP